MVEVFEYEKNFFDEDFRVGIRDHARLYFEKVIQENVVVFKQDLDEASEAISADLKIRTAEQLDASIARLTIDLKEHITKQLDGQFAEFTKAAKEAQDVALGSLTTSAAALEEQHKQLGTTLQKSIANQSLMLENSFQENMKNMTSIKEANASALESLNRSVDELKNQNEQLTATLEKKIATQEESLMKAFEGNMAQVIEHYLLGALSEQYDLKAQLPAIIQQMEANKQALLDDMKL
jgi:predicted  nucleic acid-binding Zn-ribbon protein